MVVAPGVRLRIQKGLLRFLVFFKDLINRLMVKLQNSTLTEKAELSEYLSYPGEIDNFNARHPKLREELESLFQIVNKVFWGRTFRYTKDPDRAIYPLGFACVEEFGEILLMSGNGMGLGAKKLLRSFYERALTAAYIEQNPATATSFLEYHSIHQGKLLRESKNVFDMSQALSDEKIQEIEAAFDAAKPNFQIADCRKCGTTRLNHTWTKVDVASMSKKVGGDFQTLYLAGCFLPQLQLHATPTSLMAMMKLGNRTPDTYRQEADQALRTAHILLILVLETQNRHFQLGFEKELELRREGYEKAWSP